MSKQSFTEKTLITGHRGMGVLEKPRDTLLKDAPFYPENSVAAFEQAIKEGADALECDIHVTKDGHAMVIHGSKVFQYADYIGKDKKFHLSSGDDLEVEKFTKDDLQQSFSLKSRQSKFDTLDKTEKSKVTSNEQTKAEVVKEKTTLLKTDPRSHCIPELGDLLGLACKENERRLKTGQPPLKVNIELKGQGSGVASLGAIQRFYAQNPSAEKLLPPDQIVFLGRREVGEIAIANGILKGKKDFGTGELRDQFAEEFLADSSKINPLKEPFKKAAQLKENIGTVFGQYGIHGELPGELKGMEHQVVIKSYLDAGGNPKLLDETMHSKDFVGALKKQGIEDKFLMAAKENMGMKKGDLKKYCEPKELAKTLNSEEAASNITTLTNFIGRERAVPESFDLYAEGAIEMEWRKKQVDRSVKMQLEQQAKLSIIKTNAEGYAGILQKTEGTAKTNLMVTTGQLFGKEAIANEEDFDTKPSVTEISKDGQKRVYEAFTKYGYNGIDMSLYDYTPGLIKTINQGVNDSKFIKPDQAVMGITASNWKGSKTENSLTDPCFAVTRSEAISTQCKMPVLLKVDEPGMFKDALEKSRQIDKSKQSVGKETGMMAAEITFTPKLPTGYALQEEMLSTTKAQTENPIQKISSKPPRGVTKQEKYVTHEMVHEVQHMQKGLLQESKPISSLDKLKESPDLKGISSTLKGQGASATEHVTLESAKKTVTPTKTQDPKEMTKY